MTKLRIEVENDIFLLYVPDGRVVRLTREQLSTVAILAEQMLQATDEDHNDTDDN